MNTKIFISYTLKDGILTIDFFKNLKSVVKGLCSSYIDILDNDSINKQARVEDELLKSDLLILIKTHKVNKSDWVKKEILIAQENNIPIIEYEYSDLIEKKFQPITMYIKHLADCANFKAVTSNKSCSGLTGLLSETPNASYT